LPGGRLSTSWTTEPRTRSPARETSSHDPERKEGAHGGTRGSPADKLGFTLSADQPYGEGDRWVEVTPPGGGAAIALSRGMGEYQPGRETGIALSSPDPKADHEELKAKGVAVDEELMGGDGTVPLLFMFRDVKPSEATATLPRSSGRCRLRRGGANSSVRARRYAGVAASTGKP
jgi:hypothetical protein